MDRWKIPVASVVLLLAFALRVAATPAEAQSLRTVGLSQEQTEVVETAVGLFDAAGLPLPAVTVAIGDAGDGCYPEALAYHRSLDGRSEIFLCYPNIAGRELRAILHELAHAWASIGLDDDRRQAFKDLWGWEHWRDYESADWQQNGNEQAAEIVKWGVSEFDVPVFVPYKSCSNLHEAYQVLTGLAPRHGRCGALPAGLS